MSLGIFEIPLPCFLRQGYTRTTKASAATAASPLPYPSVIQLFSRTHSRPTLLPSSYRDLANFWHCHRQNRQSWGLSLSLLFPSHRKVGHLHSVSRPFTTRPSSFFLSQSSSEKDHFSRDFVTRGQGWGEKTHKQLLLGGRRRLFRLCLSFWGRILPV